MLIGDIDIHPLTDETFRASPAYLGDHVRPDGHEDLFTRGGMAWLPIGCSLVRTGDRMILVDAGMGPEMRDDGPRRLLIAGSSSPAPHRRLLIGGQLLLGLRAVDTTVAPGITLTMTPGHTPGHLGVIVASAGRCALLLGDAIVPLGVRPDQW